MEGYSAKDLFELLNQQDECDWIEAKGGKENSHSVMETVCAFANEPGLGGGYILLGIAEDKGTLFPQYKSVHIDDPDKVQSDFVTQCSSMFNIPIRPRVSVETVAGNTVIKIKVDELPANQKPLFFKTEGLPKGAFRRIGPTDQRCTEDDLRVFYTDFKSYDLTPLAGTSINDVDEHALKRYRTLREKVNPAAEELSYDDQELLESLGCLNKENKAELNLAGLVLFGTSKALRSNFPMIRVDYIRVPGNKWIEDPDNRFTTIDMRGPLLTLLFRLIDAINSDLPKGFLLAENSLQADAVGLPTKALREAIVNAIMHRSYREHRPIQIIRYDNRIEIINPGYSLKSDDRLGEPGSETRNPFIASVFHETNLAETKGSGIRAMRKLMDRAHLAPPTFESDRGANQFVTRLLLHHFLNESDLKWLSQFEKLSLNDGQKQALIFVREVGAIDNHSYRQMTDCDVAKASYELRQLKSFDLLIPKGKGKATYYIPGNLLSAPAPDLSAPPTDLSAPVDTNLSTPAHDLSAPAHDLSAPAHDLSAPAQLDEGLQKQIELLNQREHNTGKVKDIIKKICSQRHIKAIEIATLLNKGEGYIKRKYLSEMIKSGDLEYLFPEMISHPDQAYKTSSKEINF